MAMINLTMEPNLTIMMRLPEKLFLLLLLSPAHLIFTMTETLMTVVILSQVSVPIEPGLTASAAEALVKKFHMLSLN